MPVGVFFKSSSLKPEATILTAGYKHGAYCLPGTRSRKAHSDLENN